MRTNIRKRPLLLLFFLLFICLPSSGLIISIGRNWTSIQLLIILISLLYFTKLLQGSLKKIELPKKFLLLYFLFICIAIISIIFKPDKPVIVFSEGHLYSQSYDTYGILYLAWLLLNLIMFIVLYIFIDSKKKLFWLLKALIYSSVFYAIYAIYQYLIVSLLGDGASSFVYVLKDDYLWGPDRVRPPSLSREPLYYSCYLLWIVFLILAALDSDKSILNRLKISERTIKIILALNLVAFFLSRPTAGFLALIFCTLFMFRNRFILKRKVSLRKTIKTFSFGIISLLLITLFVATNFNRIVSRFTRVTDVTSGYTRVVSVLEAISYIKDDPWTGYGLSNSQFFISKVVVHNVYVNLLAELGIFGLLSFLAIVYHLWRRSKKIYQNSISEYQVLGRTYMVYIISILIQWMSFHAFSLPSFWFFSTLILITFNIMRDEHHSVDVQKTT